LRFSSAAWLASAVLPRQHALLPAEDGVRERGAPLRVHRFAVGAGDLLAQLAQRVHVARRERRGGRVAEEVRVRLLGEPLDQVPCAFSSRPAEGAVLRTNEA
jgi:hypothetical protein